MMELQNLGHAENSVTIQSSQSMNHTEWKTNEPETKDKQFQQED